METGIKSRDMWWVDGQWQGTEGKINRVETEVIRVGMVGPGE